VVNGTRVVAGHEQAFRLCKWQGMDSAIVPREFPSMSREFITGVDTEA
jgi:hypothetical protein